jgi:heat shock protein HtpX
VVGHVVDRVILRNEQGHGLGYLAATLLAQVVLGILASPIVMWFSRQREFRADAGAARLAGTGRMVAALERLKAGSSAPLPDQLGAFGISGGMRGGLRALFSTHPSLDERIARLRAKGG